MGAVFTEDFMSQHGTKDVLKLNRKTQTLTKLTTCPEKFMAHQVIFQKPQTDTPKGVLFCFGGIKSSYAVQYECFKYDLATNKWHTLPDILDNSKRISFNMLPLLDDRYILFVHSREHLIFDTLTNTWIKVSSPEVNTEGGLGNDQ